MLFDVRVLAFDPLRAPDPADALVRAFQVDRAVAEEAVSKLPRVLKRAMPLEMAQRFCEVLDAVGAQGEIVLSEQAVRSEAARSPSARRSPAESTTVPRPSLRAGGAAALSRALGGEPEATRGSLSTIFALPEASDFLVLPDVSARFQATAQRADVAKDPESLEADLSAVRKQPSGPAARSIQPAPRALQPIAKRGDFRPARPAPSLLAETLPEAPTPEAAEAPARPEPAPELALETRLPKRAPPPMSALGRLALPGPVVDRARAELPGSRALLRGLSSASVLMGLALSVLSLGLLPLALLAIWLLDARRRHARVRAMGGTAIPVSSAQLSDLHAWVKHFATRLGLEESPRLYLGRTPSELCAVPAGDTLHVLIDPGFLARHLDEDTLHVPSFALAHELARYALGQRTRTRALLAFVWPQLAHMDVLCADALAVQLMNEREVAQRALLLLLAGPLAGEVDMAELDRQLGSHVRAGKTYEPAQTGPRGRLMARLFHMNTNYLYTAAHPRSVQR